MAGLKLTIDNWTNGTPTVMKQQDAGTTVGVDLDGDWGSYNSATAVWRLFGPSNHVPPPVLVEPAGVAAAHTFEPKMCGRYVSVLHIETNSGDKKRFSAVYEVNAPQAAEALPSPQERDEYNNETGWSTAVEHFLRLHLKELGGRKIVAIQNVGAAPIPEGNICTIFDVRRHADSADASTTALGNMENMMLTVTGTNSMVPGIEGQPLAYCLQSLSAANGGNDRGYAILQGVIPFDTDALGVVAGSLLYVSQGGDLITKAAAQAEGNYLRPVAKILKLGGSTVGANVISGPGVILFDSMPRFKTAVAFSNSFEGGLLTDGYIPTYNSAGDYVQWRSPQNAVAGISVAAAATTENTVAVWDSVDGTLLRDTQLFVDATDGMLGIGTNNPTERLTVWEDNNAEAIGMLIHQNGTNDAMVQMFVAGGASPRKYSMRVGGAHATSVMGANNWGIYDEDNSAIRMVINDSGDVGIGISEPAEKLDVAGNVGASSGGNSLTLDVDGSNSGNAGLWSDGSHLVLGSKTNNDLNIFLNDAETLQITRATSPNRVNYTSHGGAGDHTFVGNVGIGTTSPSQKLHVNGSMAVKYRNITASSSVTDDDYIIGVGFKAAPVTVTLPLSVDNVGRMLIIKDEACEAATVAKNILIQAQGAEKVIDVDTVDLNFDMTNDGQSVTLYANGTDWCII